MIERWWVTKDGEEGLALRSLDGIDACMSAAEGGRRLSTDRQSAVVQLSGSPAVLVKWRHTLPGRRLRTLLRPSRERREARAAMRAAALGIPAPRPWGAAERRSMGMLVAAALVRPFLPHHRSLLEALTEPGATEHVSTVAATLRRWHERGFRHGGCYPKNVLIAEHEPHVVPVGLAGSSFVRGGASLDRARLKDLAQMTVGCRLARPGDPPDAFVLAYARSPGAPLPPGTDLVRIVAPFVERILEKKRARVASRPAREPHGAPPPRRIPEAPGIPRIFHALT